MPTLIRCDECKQPIHIAFIYGCGECVSCLCVRCDTYEHNCPGRDKLRDLAEEEKANANR